MEGDTFELNLSVEAYQLKIVGGELTLTTKKSEINLNGCESLGNLSVECINNLSLANKELLTCIKLLNQFNASNEYEVINCKIFISTFEHYYEKIVELTSIND